jgi:hypothetical protein
VLPEVLQVLEVEVLELPVQHIVLPDQVLVIQVAAGVVERTQTLLQDRAAAA